MKQRYWSFAIAIAVFLLCELVVIQLASAERANLTETNRYIALQELSTRRARVEGLLNSNLVAIRSLRSEIASQSGITKERFQQLTEHLLTDDLHIKHIAIAPDLIIDDVYPLPGNEALLGTDYRNIESQFGSIERAIENRSIVITGPIELVQGGQAVIARIPVYLNRDDLWGMVSAIIEHQQLFADAGLYRDFRWDVQIHSREYFEPHFEQRDFETENGSAPAFLEVDVPGTHWALTATPRSGSWIEDSTPVYIIFLAGSLLSFALSMLLFSLISNQERLKHALTTISRQAKFDSLTELPNREHSIAQLEANIFRAKQADESFCLLFIDLDHFKEINDSLGHHIGDKLLKVVAQRLKNAVRESDLVARLGGDEFIIILRDCKEPMAAERCASDVLKRLHQPVQIDKQNLMTSGSIGIAVYPNDGKSATALLQAADMAMYAAKNAGRGLSFFYNAKLQDKAHQYVALSQEIISGLANEEFELHYQPIVDAQTEEVVCVEGLLRWFHPERGLVMPDTFIPVAEKTGAIREIGNYILKRACKDFFDLKKAGLKVRISLNCSPHEFYDEEAIVNWQNILRENNIAPDMVEFEITESILMPDRERQRILLREIAESGIALVVDDFGTGYSSASYLKNFPISKIKIDRSFLIGAPEDYKQKALVDALIRMAHAMNMVAVAEGVETKEQAEFLRDIGCDLMQGFLFDKALPLQELVKKYSRNK